ncbi:MAG: methylmalonyl-CoA epimerase [Clostridiales bacterium]|jgi:methylmalonyl-CoA/ethylmalonyl-CoA epimerase|nr:methylmalonyl-CoA epimerase [Clostridiales bacterium]
MNKEITNEFRFHHIGIIVRDLNAAIDRYNSFLGSNNHEYYQEFVRSQKVKVCLVPLTEGTYIEFIEPIGTNSPVYNFSRNGGGLHHLCYEVEDVEEEIQRLKGSMKLIVKPVTGLQNRIMAFLFSKSEEIGFSLIELIEKK